MTQIHPEQSPNFEGAHGVIMQVEASKLLPWLMMCAILAGSAVSFSILSFIFMHDELQQTQKITSEQRIRLEDQQVALQIAGVIKPGDGITGPGANPNRLKER